MATTIATHPVASRDEWLKQRIELLRDEKELTRRGDELAKRRQALPWLKSIRTTGSKPARATNRSPSFSTADHS